MHVRLAALACALLALAVGAPRLAQAAPGDTLAAERARLATDRGLAPLKPMDGDPTRYQAAPAVPPDAMPGGRDGWDVTLIVHKNVVTSEMLDVMTPGRPYRILTDGKALAVRVLTAAVAADLAASTLDAEQHDDAQITHVFRRGAHFAYRSVDDSRNNIHTIEVMPLANLAASKHDFGISGSGVATMPDAAIYAVGYSGGLAPVAQRIGGTFGALPDGTTPPQHVHLIFGNHTAATLTTSIAYGNARVSIPAAVHLSGVINALASPTLGGSATHARRAPTAAERARALSLAAARLKTSVSQLNVRAITAIDLGTGMAIAGTVNLRGTSTPRVDQRLFFIAESRAGHWSLSLANAQAVTVSEPLLEDVGEMIIDALDLGNGTIGVVTRFIGFDASSYGIYTRSGAAWKPVFTGGGAAN